MASYAYYLKQVSKAEDPAIILADLSMNERSAAFCAGLPKEKRLMMKRHFKYASLLETTAWLSDTRKTGCAHCASFINRDQVALMPRRITQMFPSQYFPFEEREACIAHNILRVAL